MRMMYLVKEINRKELNKATLQAHKNTPSADRNCWTVWVHNSVIEPKKRKRNDRTVRREIQEYLR